MGTQANRASQWFVPWEYNETRTYSGHDAPEYAHESIEILEDTLDPPNVRYGYPSHEKCWSLLEKVFAPHRIPYDALFDVCASMVVVHDQILDWFHDYEGRLYDAREEPSRRSDGPWDRTVTANWDSRGLNVDPWATVQLGGLFATKNMPPPPPIGVLKHHDFSPSMDHFNLLPADIKLIIADLLPVSEALQLRLTSRAFSFIFHDQSFWARRFQRNHERAWLYDIHESGLQSPLDWRLLYRLTGQEGQLPIELKNRARIWRLVHLIRNATPDQRLESFTRPVEFGPAAESDIWTKVNCQLCGDHDHPFNQAGDHYQSIFATQKAQVRRLVEIRVHIVKLGLAFFVSGMTFIAKSGRTVHLGYQSQVVRTLLLRKDPVGFNVEVGQRGFHRIQAVYEDGGLSDWAGVTSDMPLTRRLVVHEEITAFEAEFDVRCTGILNATECH